MSFSVKQLRADGKKLFGQTETLSKRVDLFFDKFEALEAKYGKTKEWDAQAIYNEMMKTGEASPSVVFKKLNPDLDIEAEPWDEAEAKPKDKLTVADLKSQTHEILHGKKLDDSNVGGAALLPPQDAPNKGEPKKTGRQPDKIDQEVKKFIDSEIEEKGGDPTDPPGIESSPAPNKGPQKGM